jgi:hypothetical protein
MHVWTALLALIALSGCHLIDDFGRFHQATDGGPELVAPDVDGSVDNAVAVSGDAGRSPIEGIDAARDGQPGPTSPSSATDAGRAAEPPTTPRVPDAGASQPGPTAGTDAGCPERGQPRPLRVRQGVVELGRLASPPSVTARVLGPSLGPTPGAATSSRLWFFTSNLTTSSAGSASRPANHPSLARDGTVTPWTEPPHAGPWRLDETLNDMGLPVPSLRLFQEEQGMNVSLFVTAALSGVTSAQADVLAFVQRSPGFFQPADSVWSARFVAGAAPGMRDMRPLFTAPEPLFGLAAFHGDGYVKLLACAAGDPSMGRDSPGGGPNGGGGGRPSAAHPCTVARAPTAKSTQRAAYEFYVQAGRNGGSWTSDVSLATPVVDGNDAQLSLSWNPYLSKFLLVHSVAFGNSVVLQTAQHVEGPWSERIEVALPAPLEWVDMFAREHPSAAQQCGKRIIISHWSPTASNGQLPTDGDVILSAIDLE